MSIVVPTTQTAQGTTVTTVGPLIYNQNLETFGLVNANIGLQVQINGAIDLNTRNVVLLLYWDNLVYYKDVAQRWFYKQNAQADWQGPTTDPRPNLSNVPPFLSAGAFTTNGNQIIDAANHNMRICAVVWAGGNFYAPTLEGLDSIDYQTTMQFMVNLNINCIVLHTHDRCVLQNLPPSNINYTIGSNTALAGLTYLQVLDVILDYANTLNLRVIIDSYSNEGTFDGRPQQNGLWYDSSLSINTDGSGNSGTITDELFLAAWQARATRWQNKPALLGYIIRSQPMVQPSNNLTWNTGRNNKLADVYTRVGNAILAIDNRPLIICPGIIDYNNGAPDGDLRAVATSPITLNVANKVVYAVVAYSNEVNNFTGGGNFSALDYDGDYINRLNTTWGYLVAQNVAPVFIYEMGENMLSFAGQNWGNIIVPYLNGTAPNGPTFSSTDYGISWAWNGWAVSRLYNGISFGMLTAWNNSRPRLAQQVFWGQMLFEE